MNSKSQPMNLCDFECMSLHCFRSKSVRTSCTINGEVQYKIARARNHVDCRHSANTQRMCVCANTSNARLHWGRIFAAFCKQINYFLLKIARSRIDEKNNYAARQNPFRRWFALNGIAQQLYKELHQSIGWILVSKRCWITHQTF